MKYSKNTIENLTKSLFKAGGKVKYQTGGLIEYYKSLESKKDLTEKEKKDLSFYKLLKESKNFKDPSLNSYQISAGYTKQLPEFEGYKEQGKELYNYLESLKGDPTKNPIVRRSDSGDKIYQFIDYGVRGPSNQRKEFPYSKSTMDSLKQHSRYIPNVARGEAPTNLENAKKSWANLNSYPGFYAAITGDSTLINEKAEKEIADVMNDPDAQEEFKRMGFAKIGSNLYHEPVPNKQKTKKDVK